MCIKKAPNSNQICIQEKIMEQVTFTANYNNKISFKHNNDKDDNNDGDIYWCIYTNM